MLLVTVVFIIGSGCGGGTLNGCYEDVGGYGIYINRIQDEVQLIDNTDYCDVTSSDINPLANEILGNGIDDNCDGDTDFFEQYEDLDGDGCGSTQFTTAEGVYNNLDCNDNDAEVHLYTIEILNGQDDDCDVSIDDGFDI